jgi:hypothetical protein
MCFMFFALSRRVFVQRQAGARKPFVESVTHSRRLGWIDPTQCELLRFAPVAELTVTIK